MREQAGRQRELLANGRTTVRNFINQRRRRKLPSKESNLEACLGKPVVTADRRQKIAAAAEVSLADAPIESRMSKQAEQN